ncbi:hypothetical protein ACO0QE_003362 [Hanseniaspora vineae]
MAEFGNHNTAKGHKQQQSYSYHQHGSHAHYNNQSASNDQNTVSNLPNFMDDEILNELPSASSNAQNTGFESDKSDTLYHYSKVLQLEHAMTNFIDGLRKILALSPNLHVYNDIVENKQDQIPVETLPALTRYKLKLGSELVSLHELGKLDILNQIMDYAQNFNKLGNNSTVPLLLSSDDYQKLVELDNMKEVEKKLSLASTSSSENLAKHGNQSLDDDPYDPKPNGSEEEDSDDGKTAAHNKGKKSSSNAPMWPPKLPKIKNAAIKARVFIHKSMINDKLYLSEHDMLNAHNERLEFLGDAILNTTITMMLYNKFPNLNEGHLSQLRMKLINNERLKEWSFLYNFQDQLIANLDLKTKLDNGQTYFQQGKQKLYSDVFEAYIGGLIEDDPKKNLPKVRKWLEKLSAPVIDEHVKSKTFVTEEEIDINSKKTLYSIIGYAALNLHYVTVRRPSTENPFAEVECRIKDEVVLGSGEGKNVKIAGMVAAQNVLKDKELVEKYANLRASIPREESVAKPEVSNKNFQQQQPQQNQSQSWLNNSDTYNPHEFGHPLSTVASPGAIQQKGNYGSPMNSRSSSARSKHHNSHSSNNNSTNSNSNDPSSETSNKKIKISKSGTFVLE